MVWQKCSGIRRSYLADLARYADEQGLAPVHRSGRQELLENIVNQALFD